MTPWTIHNCFVKLIFAGLAGAGWIALLATAAVAQTAVMPANLPLYFEANRGQADSSAQFIARGRDSQFLIWPDAAQFVLNKMTAPNTFSARTVKMQFVGGNERAWISGAEELSGKINYLIGNDSSKWRTGVATFTKVRIEAIYPGVNLTYYGNQQQIEYDFNVAPGTNPGLIAIRFDGADEISINPAGELVLNLGDGEICQLKPAIYQAVDGARREITGGYKILGTNTVGFAVGDYDHSVPLVIDPILSYSTYFGGNGNDTAWSVAVDTNGYVYVAGQTTSTQFAPGKPFATPGAFQTNYQGGTTYGDAFVAKFDNLGTNLIYLTYLGGSADDAADGITVDNLGDAYMAGWTDSANFPTTTNALYRNIGGTPTKQIGYPIDAFITELNPGGSNLVFSTYLAGSASEDATAITLDSSNNIYVTGFTYSTNFPTTANAFQKHLAVTNWVYQFYYNANAFVTEIAAGGTNLIYSSYLGGTNFDGGEGIAVDQSNHVHVAGYTDSMNFPVKNAITNLSNGYLFNGSGTQTAAFDAFVAEFSPSCTNLVYSTFLGGTNSDLAYHLAVDGSGNAYVTGWTVSTNFPNTATSVPGLHNGLTNNLVYGYSVTTNAFLTQVVWNGTNAAIGYSAVFGGTNFGADIGYGVAVDPAGNAFVVGTTSSTNFPTLNASGLLAATNSGGDDVFVTAFNINGTALLYSACLGGANNDFGYGIALDSQDNAYIVGQTYSSNFPTNNARQAALNGTANAFLAKIISFVQPPEITAIQPTNQSAGVDSTVTFVVSATGLAPLSYQWQMGTNLMWTNLVNGGGISGATNATLTISNVQMTNGGNYQVIVTNYGGSVTSSVAILNVTNVATVLTLQPASQIVGVGATVTFEVDGTAQEPFYLQWLKNGTNLVDGTNSSGSIISGSTNDPLTIINAQTNDDGTYWLVISNVWGVLASSNAVLTVVPFPTILVPPTNQTAGLGGIVNFSVTAVGQMPLSYQWLMNGTNAVGGHISGANTNSTVTVTNTQTSDNGSGFLVIVTNIIGAVTSSPPAILTVLTAPLFTSITSEGGTNFSISGVGGTNSGTFYLLSTTNLALPLTNWTSLGTNTFDSQGGFGFTDSLTNALPQEFFILQMQSP